jgi:hypothetical protein
VTLNRTVGASSITYNSPAVPIDPLASGSLRVIVYDGATELDRVTYRTVT